MSVDDNTQLTLAQKLLANIEAGNGNPYTLLPRLDSKEFIVRVQLSHERHYVQVHQMLEEARFARTITTQDNIRRDLPHAMFYLRTEQKVTNKAVFAVVAKLLKDHAELHRLHDLNPQIMVMDAKDVHLDLDPSKQS
jgi:Fe-S cluster assembly ATPase SufC